LVQCVPEKGDVCCGMLDVVECRSTVGALSLRELVDVLVVGDRRDDCAVPARIGAQRRRAVGR
jgi:hypothetical protein